MYFQKVMKGIKGISANEVTTIISQSGIVSNWWRTMGTITPDAIKQQLTEGNVLNHLNHYDDALPVHHPLYQAGKYITYGDVTPFISTTAGAVQRQASAGRNIRFPAFMTALRFATGNFKTTGHIFYAYLITLGKKAIPLSQFSEEARELHIYRSFLPYHGEGEIVAKIHIPAIQIEKVEEYDGPAVRNALKQHRMPVPTNKTKNLIYTPPEKYSNIREYF